MPLATPFFRIGNLAAMHLINDALAACLLLQTGNILGPETAGISALVYSFAAFGLQAPIGFWMDKVRGYRQAIILSALLMAVFLAIHASHIMVLVYFLFGLLGLVSAIFHTYGGALVLQE